MNLEKNVHDIKTILRRLEIMTDLLARRDFSAISKEEILKDIPLDLERLKDLLGKIS